ncbi:hypothetical protein GJU40_17965 [Bacillus lacus]|uniref:Peptidase M50 domain-containing protein n=1 Tax=Metabacillus lacus TaxID=1983721 RepID=A0A7X2M111_9BACI|nr:site-2 protease family protein [Metabacillus lacus]MRX74017.1 hypothetical protein [Metabacillus lacus]
MTVNLVYNLQVSAWNEVFDWGRYVLIILFILFIMYSALIIHEVGHLIAEKYLGYEFQILHLGPLVIENQNGKKKIRINKRNFNWGQCVMLPHLNSYNKFIKEYPKYLAAGSLANLLVAVMGSIILAVSGNSLWILLLISHLLIAFIALIPLKAEGIYYTDGLAIKVLLKNNETSEVYYYLLKLSYKLLFNKEVNDLSELPQLEKKIEGLVSFEQKNRLHEELSTYLIYELSTYYFLSEAYEKCFNLLSPFFNKKTIKGPLKEELRSYYLYASYTLANNEKNKNGTSWIKTERKSSTDHLILELKLDAFNHLMNNQKELAIACLKEAKEAVRRNKRNIHSTDTEINIINRLKSIIEAKTI